MSQTGFVIKYADCTIFFKYKLQTEIALSTAKAEYIALSTALREVIPLMTLMEEINEIIPLHITKPDFYCKVWDDNQSCIAMANSQKFSPRIGCFLSFPRNIFLLGFIFQGCFRHKIT